MSSGNDNANSSDKFKSSDSVIVVVRGTVRGSCEGLDWADWVVNKSGGSGTSGCKADEGDGKEDGVGDDEEDGKGADESIDKGASEEATEGAGGDSGEDAGEIAGKGKSKIAGKGRGEVAGKEAGESIVAIGTVGTVAAKSGGGFAE